MKVLVVNWRDINHPEAGGAEIHIHELLKRKPLHWNVDFISARFPNGAFKDETPWYRIIRLPFPRLFNFVFFFWWIGKGRKNNYDLVIDDISKIPLATPWYIHCVPLSAIMHHIHGKSLYTILSWPLATYVYCMEKWLLAAYTKTPLLAVSPSTAEELRKLYAYQKLHVVYNGIERKPVSFEEKMAQRAPEPLIVYLGRLKSYKRVDYFLRMAALISQHFPKISFVIAGHGEEMENLKRLSKELGIEEKVLFTGFVDENTKYDLLLKAWLKVLPSQKEGWGIVVIEANAMGTPVIGYHIPGVKDSIQDGKTGLLVKNCTPEALGEAVQSLLRDHNQWENLSRNALEWAGGFHWDEMAKEFYTHINNCLREWHDKQSL